MEELKFGILTVSDSCHKNPAQNTSGPKLRSLISHSFPTGKILYEDIVPDEKELIENKLKEWCDNSEGNCDVILTSGGTGLAPRDVTPDATRAIVEKEIPGIVQALISKSLTVTPFAMLSRPVCGVLHKTLIINLPGSTKAVTEHFDVLVPVLQHAVALVQDNFQNVRVEHKNIQEQQPSKVQLTSAAKRSRTSSYPMIEVEQVLEIIRTFCIRTSLCENIDIVQTLGRVLAEDICSSDPLPPFPASIKDGYAVRANDGAGKRFVMNSIIAGDQPGNENTEELRHGHCIRISTGAPVPPGADAVVQVEDTELIITSENSEDEVEIEIKVEPKLKQDIRPIGSDIPKHAVILKKGHVLNAAELGLLATIGKMNVNVYKIDSIGVLSTGNEIQNPREPLQPGCIRDSNKITLIALLQQYGYSAKDCGIAADNPDIIKNCLTKAFETCDFIITSGGMSMGEYDLVKEVLLQDFKAVIHFGRVNMKPGKPLMFATCEYKNRMKMIFGLPGNPVSATVTCLLFVIPTLRYKENRSSTLSLPSVFVKPDFNVTPDPSRPEYHRVKLSYLGSTIQASSTGNQISSKLNSCAGADGLMLVPPSVYNKLKEFNATPDPSQPALASSASSIFGVKDGKLSICAPGTKNSVFGAPGTMNSVFGAPGELNPSFSVGISTPVTPMNALPSSKFEVENEDEDEIDTSEWI